MMELRRIAGLGLCVAVIAVGVSACVQFKTATLYDGIEPLPPRQKPTSISSVVAPVIYRDETKDMWGLETDACKFARISNENPHSGTASIAIDWDLGKGCDWAGIGIGWNDYVGKDLSSIIDYAAIEFYVRTGGQKMFELPIVLTLEDHTGGQGFAYTSMTYLEQTPLDINWQRVVVPLNAFDMKVANLDPTNVKQIMFALQKSGSIFIDDIELILYEAPYVAPWMVEEVLPDPALGNITLFDEGFINGNGWGMMADECQDFSIETGAAANGQKAIHAKWNVSEHCKWVTLGVSWNKWRPINLTSVVATKAVEFQIKNLGAPSNELPMKLLLDNYAYQTASVPLKSSFVASGTYDGQWRQVRIPLSAFDQTIDFKNIKQLRFEMSGSGDVLIDSWKLVDL